MSASPYWMQQGYPSLLEEEKGALRMWILESDSWPKTYSTIISAFWNDFASCPPIFWPLLLLLLALWGSHCFHICKINHPELQTHQPFSPCLQSLLSICSSFLHWSWSLLSSLLQWSLSLIAICDWQCPSSVGCALHCSLRNDLYKYTLALVSWKSFRMRPQPTCPT